MRRWTRASFDAVCEFDETVGADIAWLPPRPSDDRPTDSEPLARKLRHRLGRGVALIGVGCLATAGASNTALAPVKAAHASVEHAAIEPAAIEPPGQFSIDVASVPAFVSSADELREIEFDRQRREVEEFLRFGAREVPRRIVDTIVRAAAATEVDPIYLMALADKESGFRAEVKAPTSSAEGLFQFIDRTWLEMVRAYGDKHGLGAEVEAISVVDEKPTIQDDATRVRVLEMRRDPYLAAVMAAELLKRDAALIGFRIGRRLTQTEMYIAHFLGLEDAARFIELKGAKRAASAVKAFPAAARANAAIFFARQKRGRRGLSVPEVYARIDGMIAPRVERYQDVTRYAEAGV